jgi:glycosyltransferase involved in cell wall biosynthesis
MARVHVDVSDLFDHFLAFGNVTGIQRVSVELARRVTEVSNEARVIAFTHALGRPIELPRGSLFGQHDVRDALTAGDPLVLVRDGPDPARRPWIQRAFPALRPPLVFVRATALRIANALSAAKVPKGITPAELRAGDIVIVPGAIWGQRAYIKRLESLSKRGVRVHVVIHDLILIKYPELSDPVTCRLYRRFFDDVSRFAAGLICISQSTRRDVEEHLASLGRSGVRIDMMPLAHEFLGTVPEELKSPRNPLLAGLEESRFALIVGTVEVRKNHLRLAEAWQSLMREQPDRTPTLVIAGKLGWKIPAFKALMEETGWLGGKILHVDNASDVDLAWLYRNSMFSVFPSTYEGWGLPVGESAWFGRPCVTSNVSSLPEVLGEASILCDPLSVASIADAIRPLMMDDQALEAATTRVRAMKLRTWRDVAERLVADLSR